MQDGDESKAKKDKKKRKKEEAEDEANGAADEADGEKKKKKKKKADKEAAAAEEDGAEKVRGCCVVSAQRGCWEGMVGLDCTFAVSEILNCACCWTFGLLFGHLLSDSSLFGNARVSVLS
jgi:hypothetical protein